MKKKKLYGKRKIHPSHHSHQPSVISDQYLSFLPATILTLTAALSVDDREVLAYLISCSAFSSSSSVVKLYSNRSNNNNSTASYKKSYSSRNKDHPVLFNCSCFTCYMSYWVRWDSSSNRQLIHEIIDAYEDELATKKKVIKRNTDRRNKKGFHGSNCFDDLKNLKESRNEMSSTGELKSVEMIGSEETEEEEEKEDEADESGSIRKCMNFLVSKILDVWNQ